jgi:hypothetical protein
MNMLFASCIVTGLLFLAVCVELHFKSINQHRQPAGMFAGRRRTADISFLAQSPTGFIGRLTRTVPAPKVFPYLQDGTNPVASFGLACLQTASTVRGMLAGDTAVTSIFGITVGNFPFQQQSTNNYGSATIGGLIACPTSGVLDVMKSGAMMVYCNSAQAPTANLTSGVYVWIAATSGTHIQGGFETAANSTNTIGPLPNAYFNGPGDSTGAIELTFNA